MEAVVEFFKNTAIFVAGIGIPYAYDYVYKLIYGDEKPSPELCKPVNASVTCNNICPPAPECHVEGWMFFFAKGVLWLITGYALGRKAGVVIGAVTLWCHECKVFAASSQGGNSPNGNPAVAANADQNAPAVEVNSEQNTPTVPTAVIEEAVQELEQSDGIAGPATAMAKAEKVEAVNQTVRQKGSVVAIVEQPHGSATDETKTTTNGRKFQKATKSKRTPDCRGARDVDLCGRKKK